MHEVAIEELERLVKEKTDEAMRCAESGDMVRARLLQARVRDMETSIAWLMNERQQHG